MRLGRRRQWRLLRHRRRRCRSSCHLTFRIGRGGLKLWYQNAGTGFKLKLEFWDTRYGRKSCVAVRGRSFISFLSEPQQQCMISPDRSFWLETTPDFPEFPYAHKMNELAFRDWSAIGLNSSVRKWFWFWRFDERTKNYVQVQLRSMSVNNCWQKKSLSIFIFHDVTQWRISYCMHVMGSFG